MDIINNCEKHPAADDSPVIVFTEANMVTLLTAYKSLGDLEKLLSMISAMDPSNGILWNLRHMDDLIQDLSPLYDPMLDYDKQLYTLILENEAMDISDKAHILLGSKEDYKNTISGSNPAAGNSLESSSLSGSNAERTAIFTVDNMVDLLTALYGYRNLVEVLQMFFGSYPSNSILFGLSHLNVLLEDLSPIYHVDHDDDEAENEEYVNTLNSSDIGLRNKALVLMGALPE